VSGVYEEGLAEGEGDERVTRPREARKAGGPARVRYAGHCAERGAVSACECAKAEAEGRREGGGGGGEPGELVLDGCLLEVRGVTLLVILLEGPEDRLIGKVMRCVSSDKGT